MVREYFVLVVVLSNSLLLQCLKAAIHGLGFKTQRYNKAGP